MVAFPDAVTLWKNRCIPYEMMAFRSRYRREEIRRAMDQWEMACGVSFVPRCREANYVMIREGSGTSAIGMQGGKQDAFMHDSGFGDNTARFLHELGHTLGLINEQCRSDRDDFINVEWDNISSGKVNSEFQKRSSQNLTAYDSDSVMHNPSPGRGWGGLPVDGQVWTMRWKADLNRDLGVLGAMWPELSALDKSPTGLRARYKTEPVPLVSEIANGGWLNPYAIQFPFRVVGKQFFFGHNLEKREWFIQELAEDGTMGRPTQNGSWNNAYHVILPFTIDRRVFIYGHNTSTKYWFIQELEAGGKLGKETDSGHWNNAYAVSFPFAINGRQYFYGQNRSNNYWFIQEFRPGGRMGEETDNGQWQFDCDFRFPVDMDGFQYLYGYHVGEKILYIRKITRGGKMDSQTGSVYLSDMRLDIQSIYSINGNHYLYSQDSETNYWTIRRLPSESQTGDILQRGSWSQFYPVLFTFTQNGRCFFYGNSASGNKWFIQALKDI